MVSTPWAILMFTWWLHTWNHTKPSARVFVVAASWWSSSWFLGPPLHCCNLDCFFCIWFLGCDTWWCFNTDVLICCTHSLYTLGSCFCKLRLVNHWTILNVGTTQYLMLEPHTILWLLQSTLFFNLQPKPFCNNLHWSTPFYNSYSGQRHHPWSWCPFMWLWLSLVCAATLAVLFAVFNQHSWWDWWLLLLSCTRIWRRKMLVSISSIPSYFVCFFLGGGGCFFWYCWNQYCSFFSSDSGNRFIWIKCSWNFFKDSPKALKPDINIHWICLVVILDLSLQTLGVFVVFVKAVCWLCWLWTCPGYSWRLVLTAHTVSVLLSYNAFLTMCCKRLILS